VKHRKSAAIIGILDFASGKTAPEAACGAFVLEIRPWWDNVPVGYQPLVQPVGGPNQARTHDVLLRGDVPRFLSLSVTHQWSNSWLSSLREMNVAVRMHLGFDG